MKNYNKLLGLSTSIILMNYTLKSVKRLPALNTDQKFEIKIQKFLNPLINSSSEYKKCFASYSAHCFNGNKVKFVNYHWGEGLKPPAPDGPIIDTVSGAQTIGSNFGIFL